MDKRRIATAFLLSVFITVALAAPAAAAGWEQGLAVPSDAAASAGADQTWEDPEAFKEEVLRLVNLERANNGLDALEEIQTLTEAADIRAEESSVSFSHTRPSLESCATVYAECGLTYSAAGENLSRGFSSPDKLVAAWMASKPHRANILSENFTHVGIGFYVDAEGKIYCSQLFYTPACP